MRWFDVGQEAVGVIAIGQHATGVIAIGQLATGVIAIGQLARGVFVVGQVAIGVAVFGQLVVSLTYGGGMVGVAGARATPSLLVWGLGGSGRLLRNRRWAPKFVASRTSGVLTALRAATMVAVAVVVGWVGLSWIPSYLGGGFDDAPAPPPTTFAPGTR